MPAPLEPLLKVKCTYDDCYDSFDTESAMKRHKKYSDEHDYCHKCDEDFPDFEAFAFHKILRPDEHDKACRVCGDEFKSLSGMRRHIELNHKVDQKLICIGCHKPFYRACLFIEHLEFGHCDVISASQFQKHIVHKLLITQLLDDSNHYARFLQKQSNYEASQDHEEEGGVDLGSAMLDDEEIEDVKFKAIEPDTRCDSVAAWDAGPYPPLPSKASGLASALGGLSLTGMASESSTVVHSPLSSPKDSSFSAQSSRRLAHHVSSTQGSVSTSNNRQPKVWGSRNGKSTSSTLFPGAKPTPVPSEFSVAAYDDRMEQERGPHMMKSRFWDPESSEFDPERFYDAVVQRYYCPFVCEQNFLTPADLTNHIHDDHRIVRMKCPACLKYFKSATALMAHCESLGAKCNINQADNFNIFLDRISGGFLAVDEKIRPDHLNNPSVLLPNHQLGRPPVPYQPPVASYLQYSVTTPPDWKEPQRLALVDGRPNMQQQVRW
ncbi:hypothetical protein BDU57DRAFT_445196 [Ampelomyces quisqualis]|uniref:C2H2-type domain-containing protein n=1 Tax=Ampelomyces quisqualis TaxID=50730 RepID=A0A6A5QVC9_AMPQU|nr:hypothetical protein BDU57DRAFT_445196 [Ampelomyces quisqualis]